MMKIDVIENYLEELIPDAKCELNYNKDYELLIATMLSAQTTDKRVNSVTSVLFDKYNTLKELKEAPVEDISSIIKSIGSFRKKAVYTKEIARILDEKYNGVLPNSRKALESMPGVGRKTTNVVLSNIYNVPNIAVDTHVERISKRLGLAKDKDDVRTVEEKLKRKFKRENWSRRHHQLVLFGRYYCKAISPNCEDCKLKDYCKYYKNKK
ncbi:MAG: endonuclease III [Bacilli bacterium]